MSHRKNVHTEMCEAQKIERFFLTFQGHGIRVHRSFILPENTLQVAKVSKILHGINNETIHKYKGKDFDQIDFADKGLFINHIVIICLLVSPKSLEGCSLMSL